MKTVADELASVKAKLVTSHGEGADFRWNTHSIAKEASMVGDDVSHALMPVSGEAVDVTRQKVSINGFELKDALKRV